MRWKKGAEAACGEWRSGCCSYAFYSKWLGLGFLYDLQWKMVISGFHAKWYIVAIMGHGRQE